MTEKIGKNDRKNCLKMTEKIVQKWPKKLFKNAELPKNDKKFFGVQKMCIFTTKNLAHYYKPPVIFGDGILQLLEPIVMLIFSCNLSNIQKSHKILIFFDFPKATHMCHISPLKYVPYIQKILMPFFRFSELLHRIAASG